MARALSHLQLNPYMLSGIMFTGRVNRAFCPILNDCNGYFAHLFLKMEKM